MPKMHNAKNNNECILLKTEILLIFATSRTKFYEIKNFTFSTPVSIAILIPN